MANELMRLSDVPDTNTQSGLVRLSDVQNSSETQPDCVFVS